jgi:hypothetical protein
MAPESSSALIDWFVNYFASTPDGSILGAIVYEMFGLQDAFGQVMLNNLQVFESLFPRCFHLNCKPSQGTCPCRARPRTPRSIHSLNVSLDTGSGSHMH